MDDRARPRRIRAASGDRVRDEWRSGSARHRCGDLRPSTDAHGDGGHVAGGADRSELHSRARHRAACLERELAWIGLRATRPAHARVRRVHSHDVAGEPLQPGRLRGRAHQGQAVRALHSRAVRIGADLPGDGSQEHAPAGRRDRRWRRLQPDQYARVLLGLRPTEPAGRHQDREPASRGRGDLLHTHLRRQPGRRRGARAGQALARPLFDDSLLRRRARACRLRRGRRHESARPSPRGSTRR